MSNRQKKCPGCGLANFRDAAECQWCALALSGRARTELIDDAPAASNPWGAVLIMFAVAILCGGIVWHLTRKAVMRAEQLATETAEAAAPAKPARRAGPPSLSGRSPSDPTRREFDESLWELRRDVGSNAEANRRLSEDVRLGPEEVRRAMEAHRARQREIEERAREAEQPPPPDTPDDW